jgi:hypothetical protein
MEKYSQFRDKGTAIAPFLPVPPPPVGLAWTPIYAFLFLCRIPFVVGLSVFYFGIVEWLPVGGTIKYALLWALLGLTGVWWVDFQVDGVKRGYVILPALKEDEEADKISEDSQKQRSTLLRLARSLPPRSRPLSIRSTSQASSNPSSRARTQTAAKSSASRFSARFFSHSRLPQSFLKMNRSSSPLPPS